MKFLCLCHYDPARFADLSPELLATIPALCAPHDAALHASGHLVAVGSLAEAEQYAVIRPGDGAPRVTRGPIASTPEPFGAFFVVEAGSLDEAVAIASLHPG
ncbi:MAG: YciI family protein, partial [Arenimonas sp.]